MRQLWLSMITLSNIIVVEIMLCQCLIKYNNTNLNIYLQYATYITIKSRLFLQVNMLELYFKNSMICVAEMSF